MMTRRQMLSLSSSPLILPLLGSCARTIGTTYPNTNYDAEVKAVLAAEADQAQSWRGTLDRFFEAEDFGPDHWNWHKVTSTVRPDPEWAPENLGIDTAPFTRFGTPNKNFTISDEILTFLSDRNAFRLNPEDNPVLFGIRGARLKQGATDSDWNTYIAAERIEPDHQSMRCLIGVWDRQRKRIRAFQGSTVPEVSYMWRTALGQSGSNLLPSGMYYYNIGTHRSGTKSQQLKALRLAGLYFTSGSSRNNSQVLVLRTYEDLIYNPTGVKTEFWDRCEPFDNIHGSVWEPNQDSNKGLVHATAEFSSAGCQVIRGAYEIDGARRFTDRATHEWLAFRDAIGAQALADGSPFRYMLLSSADYALAEAAPGDFSQNYLPLRIGSEGPRVADYQRRTRVEADGQFGVLTTGRHLGKLQRLLATESHIVMEPGD